MRSGPFKYIGMARVGTQLKLRFSNNDLVEMQLKSRGERNVAMVKLSHPLSKKDSVRYMKMMVPMFHTPERMEVLDSFLEKNDEHSG